MSSISLLMRKDLLLLKRYLWLIVIYTIIFSGFVQKDNLLLYNFLPMLLLILVVNNDMQPSSQQFLGTLPVRRKILVLSKYASAGSLLIIAGILGGLVNSLARYYLDGNMYFHTLLVVGSIISGLLFMALYIPLFYWIGPKGGQFLNIVLILFVMMGNGIVTGILSTEQTIIIMDWFNNHPVESGVICGGAIIVAILTSYVISTAIFKKRDI
ncbi:ABC-2 family transporter protein [Fontibacillus panacisegetis]|uniref:ABC-2 family transporter protein n=1 Tax=Fontibacillus panacisegetis TaxID=670482 RepID=A0A1G7EKL9_9BACL|nr:ABC-2 transporter permease [Fontibacillus panacisegetis]SDE64213.1 ABC-2 family transporter protein [Fontibacillus panacisegetis]